MKFRVLAIALICALAISVCFNILLYSQNQNILHAYSQQNDFSLYNNEFNKTPILYGNYSSFAPPVSLYRALRIALISGGWNATSLESTTISVRLLYCGYWSNSSGLPGGMGQETKIVTEPVQDYSPMIVNGTTYRYLWCIQINENSIRHPVGLYLIDAATAESFPPGDIW